MCLRLPARLVSVMLLVGLACSCCLLKSRVSLILSRRVERIGGAAIEPGGHHLVDPSQCDLVEISPMVHQPVNIIQALVDDVLLNGTLVFDDDRAAVFIDAERVDASAVHRPG